MSSQYIYISRGWFCFAGVHYQWYTNEHFLMCSHFHSIQIHYMLKYVHHQMLRQARWRPKVLLCLHGLSRLNLQVQSRSSVMTVSLKFAAFVRSLFWANSATRRVKLWPKALPHILHSYPLWCGCYHKKMYVTAKLLPHLRYSNNFFPVWITSYKIRFQQLLTSLPWLLSSTSVDVE